MNRAVRPCRQDRSPISFGRALFPARTGTGPRRRARPAGRATVERITWPFVKWPIGNEPRRPGERPSAGCGSNGSETTAAAGASLVCTQVLAMPSARSPSPSFCRASDLAGSTRSATSSTARAEAASGSAATEAGMPANSARWVAASATVCVSLT